MTVLVRNTTIATVNTEETLFTANSRTIIRAFTAANNAGSNVSYVLRINGEVIIPFKVVIRNRFDTGASLVNHTMNEGDVLTVENSQANGIVFNMSGEVNV